MARFISQSEQNFLASGQTMKKLGEPFLRNFHPRKWGKSIGAERERPVVASNA